MLQNLSEQVRECYQRAEECARQAQNVQDETLRAFYVRREQAWFNLARTLGVEERLTLFADENRREREDAGNRPIGKVDADPKRLYNKMIGIVDDDEYARLGLAAFIESLGYDAATFASAEEYLASDLSNNNTQCLILDVHLPGMSGPRLQAQLIADARCPPTVFVTGRFEERVQKQVIAAGALGYLTKPCNAKTLQHCIGILCATA